MRSAPHFETHNSSARCPFATILGLNASAELSQEFSSSTGRDGRTDEPRCVPRKLLKFRSSMAAMSVPHPTWILYARRFTLSSRKSADQPLQLRLLHCTRIARRHSEPSIRSCRVQSAACLPPPWRVARADADRHRNARRSFSADSDRTGAASVSSGLPRNFISYPLSPPLSPGPGPRKLEASWTTPAPGPRRLFF